MRGLIPRALLAFCVASAAGCFLLSGQVAPPAAARSETHSYWQKVSEILARKPAGADMKSLVKLVQEQTDALKELPTEGVDADLAAAVSDLIKCEEDVLWRASQADSDPEILKQSKPMAVAFADANRKAAEAKKKLKGMRSLMSDRHGGGFAPMV